MLLSILELIITLGCILEQARRFHVNADNIMYGKPSRLSSTTECRSNSKDTYCSASYANDGTRTSWPARSDYQKGPFWQGDLRGFYTVHKIFVTSDDILPTSSEIKSAFIGVSSVDVNCPDDDVTWCGQWPAKTLSRVTLTFICSREQPVRFVRVWRNITGRLAVQEVEVEGTPKTTNSAKYDKRLNRKLSAPVTSVNAISPNDCGIKCHVTQPCIGFSYNPSADPPCLFATYPLRWTTANDWVSYTRNSCSHNISCDLTDQLK